MEPIFPAEECDGGDPYREIARHVGCKEDDVWRAFQGLSVPEWEIPQHLDAVKSRTFALNAAARKAKDLQSAMDRLSNDELADLQVAGAVTIWQVEHLHMVLAGHATSLRDWHNNRNRRGGRNPGAYMAAEGIRRLYRRLRKKITFGQHPEGGPSTDFGRAVEFAIGEFGIRADWRNPAQESFGKQSRIQARLARCAHANALRKAQARS